MKSIRLCSVRLLTLAVAVAAAAFTLPLHASTIDWTHWTAAVSGNPGSASGSLGSGVTVTYAGENNGLLIGYPSWNPASTFSGGTVGNAPPAANNAVALTGGSAYTETITFSSAVTDPVMAIWSLGQPGVAALFDFTSSEPFSIQAGGPSAEYGGTSITQSGNNVMGNEGNGVIQFSGSFTQLTFTTPNFENYYAFTVGSPAAASAVPEPGTYLLLATGIGMLFFFRRSFHGLGELF